MSGLFPGQDAGIGWTVTPLRLNGQNVELRAPIDETLAQSLRWRLGLTSVRETCGLGICGTCTVLVDGKAVGSCLVLTVQLRGATVTTAEGLVDRNGGLGAVQRAFLEYGAFQCGFCIPAMTLAVQAALTDRGCRTVPQVASELSGNLCRCGSYPQILGAIGALLECGVAPTGELGLLGDDSGRECRD